ncbi:Uncharacterized protein APZ42_008851, partial [Daphnia magna]
LPNCPYSVGHYGLARYSLPCHIVCPLPCNSYGLSQVKYTSIIVGNSPPSSLKFLFQTTFNSL